MNTEPVTEIRLRSDNGLRGTIGLILDLRANFACISPTCIATEALALLDRERTAPSLVYLACHLQLRQIARELLRDFRAQFDGSNFFGLQQRYPIARSTRGDDPEYVLRDLLSNEDIAYNVARLRAEALAKLQHADALEAWGRSRHSAA